MLNQLCFVLTNNCLHINHWTLTIDLNNAYPNEAAIQMVCRTSHWRRRKVAQAWCWRDMWRIREDNPRLSRGQGDDPHLPLFLLLLSRDRQSSRHRWDAGRQLPRGAANAATDALANESLSAATAIFCNNEHFKKELFVEFIELLKIRVELHLLDRHYKKTIVWSDKFIEKPYTAPRIFVSAEANTISNLLTEASTCLHQTWEKQTKVKRMLAKNEINVLGN